MNRKRGIESPVALVCSEIPQTSTHQTTTACTRNQCSVDGMHVCMKNGVGGRIQARLACVLSCAYPS